MDMYRFVAICENDSTSKQLTYTPENFEGVKINREFSFVPPYGFTPKFAVDTMRVIKEDAAFFIAKNVEFGYFLKMKLYVSKLNADGMTYSPFVTLFVNYETITQTKDYVEFSVDVSYATNYFNDKKGKKILTLNQEKTPIVDFYKRNKVNVSLESLYIGQTAETIQSFFATGDNIIYDGDTSLSSLTIINSVGATETFEGKNVIYNCVDAGEAVFYIGLNVQIKVSNVNGVGHPEVDLHLSIYGQNGALKSHIYYEYIPITQDEQIVSFVGSHKYVKQLAAGDFVLMYFGQDDLGGLATFEVLSQDINISIRKQTNQQIVINPIKCISLNDIFVNLFGDVTSLISEGVYITSDYFLVNKKDELSVVPEAFLREASIGFGCCFNFNSEDVKVEYINDYFERLYANDRIVIDTYKDLTVKNNEKIYSSLTFGCEKFDGNGNIYLFPFQKKLTFLQSKENGDNLEFVTQKLSFDTEKIVSRILQSNVSETNNTNDNYYCVPLRNIQSNENINIADYATPREMLMFSEPLVYLYFGNYNNKTLQISDYDGVDTALIYDGVDEHSDIVLANKRHLHPIVYEFTALLGEADFSEHMAQIVDFNGETVDLFVYSSETTDKLSEIKCKALVFK